MEDLVNFFTTNFSIFSQQYRKESIKYNDVYGGVISGDTRYIVKSIRDKISKLKKYVEAGNIKIFYTSQPSYFIEFLVFYLRWIEYILNKIKPATRDITITIYLTSAKKVFPKDGKRLSPLNVNSGVTTTYSYTNRRDVIVFREEEVFKVAMHEMIHAYNIDSIYIPELSEKEFQAYFGRKCKLYINESFTDTLACIYNVLSFSVLLVKFKDSSLLNIDSKDVLPIFTKYILKERAYILEKSKDVLLYEGYAFNKKGLVQMSHEDESTHILSYYVLKAMNFHNLEEFVSLLSSQGFYIKQDYLYISMMAKSVGIIINKSEKENYWSYISRLKKQHLSPSLRMSVIDIKLLLKFVKDKLLKSIVT